MYLSTAPGREVAGNRIMLYPDDSNEAPSRGLWFQNRVGVEKRHPGVSLLSLSLITMALTQPVIKPQQSNPQHLVFWSKEEDTEGAWGLGVNSE